MTENLQKENDHGFTESLLLECIVTIPQVPR